jgi:hypothetical protein
MLINISAEFPASNYQGVLMKEAASSSETSVSIYYITQCNILEKGHILLPFFSLYEILISM